METSHSALIEDAERRAERLIGILRIIVGIALMLVFNVAVEGTAPAGDDVVVNQQLLARVTILLFMAIGLLAIVLSARRFYRPSFAYGFVTADVLFVLASLATSIANTSTSPALLIALPSVCLVPLVVAFNALRYNWRLQLFGSVLMLGGLTFLVGDARPPEMPHDVLFYAPPNIMRLAMIAAACAVLGLAVMRGRMRLIQALEDERRRQSLTRFLPGKIANFIEEQSADALRAGTRQTVTVMFIDIRGFTARSEQMAPDAVREFLVAFRKYIAAAADANDGVIDKFIGDGAMIVFGAPTPRPDDARRAVAAAKSILAAMKTWSDALSDAGEPPVRIGIGIHAGEAFVGAVGDDDRLEFTVIGDVVNVASRLEEATKIAGAPIIASGAVVKASGVKSAEWRSVSPIPIRGHSKRIDIFTLIEI